MPKKGSLFWQAESLVCVLWSKRKALQSCTHAPASAEIRAYLPFSEKKKSFLQSLRQSSWIRRKLGERENVKRQEEIDVATELMGPALTQERWMLAVGQMLSVRTTTCSGSLADRTAGVKTPIAPNHSVVSDAYICFWRQNDFPFPTLAP